MLKKYKLETNNSEKKIHDIFFIIFLLLLLFIGLIGPKILKIDYPIFNFSLLNKNFGKASIDVNKLEKFKTNKNYLSSDQINNKNIVLEWSKKTLYNVENDLPIARMYFPHIPKNINEFQTQTKKNVFLSILLPIALRGNELVLE